MQEPWKTDKWYTSLWNHLPEARRNTKFQSSIKIHDVTLRDGEQQTAVVFRREEKVAIAKKLDLPVAPREKIVDKAETLMPELKDGDSFDAAYTAQQVKENEDAIALFQKEGAASDVPEIKALVDETLPKLEERLQKARALASTYGKGHQGDG